MANDKVKSLYENVSSKFSLPDFDTFVSDMQDEGKLKEFYGSVSKEFDLPDYSTFKSDMDFGSLKKKEGQLQSPVPSTKFSELGLQPSSDQYQSGSLDVAPPSATPTRPDGEDPTKWLSKGTKGFTTPSVQTTSPTQAFTMGGSVVQEKITSPTISPGKKIIDLTKKSRVISSWINDKPIEDTFVSGGEFAEVDENDNDDYGEDPVKTATDAKWYMSTYGLLKAMSGGDVDQSKPLFDKDGRINTTVISADNIYNPVSQEQREKMTLLNKDITEKREQARKVYDEKFRSEYVLKLQSGKTPFEARQELVVESIQNKTEAPNSYVMELFDKEAEQEYLTDFIGNNTNRNVIGRYHDNSYYNDVSNKLQLQGFNDEQINQAIQTERNSWYSVYTKTVKNDAAIKNGYTGDINDEQARDNFLSQKAMQKFLETVGTDGRRLSEVSEKLRKINNDIWEAGNRGASDDEMRSLYLQRSDLVDNAKKLQEQLGIDNTLFDWETGSRDGDYDIRYALSDKVLTSYASLETADEYDRLYGGGGSFWSKRNLSRVGEGLLGTSDAGMPQYGADVSGNKSMAEDDFAAACGAYYLNISPTQIVKRFKDVDYSTFGSSIKGVGDVVNYYTTQYLDVLGNTLGDNAYLDMGITMNTTQKRLLDADARLFANLGLNPSEAEIENFREATAEQITDVAAQMTPAIAEMMLTGKITNALGIGDVFYDVVKSRKYANIVSKTFSLSDDAAAKLLSSPIKPPLATLEQASLKAEQAGKIVRGAVDEELQWGVFTAIDPNIDYTPFVGAFGGAAFNMPMGGVLGITPSSTAFGSFTKSVARTGIGIGTGNALGDGMIAVYNTVKNESSFGEEIDKMYGGYDEFAKNTIGMATLFTFVGVPKFVRSARVQRNTRAISRGANRAEKIARYYISNGHTFPVANPSLIPGLTNALEFSAKALKKSAVNYDANDAVQVIARSEELMSVAKELKANNDIYTAKFMEDQANNVKMLEDLGVEVRPLYERSSLEEVVGKGGEKPEMEQRREAKTIMRKEEANRNKIEEERISSITDEVSARIIDDTGMDVPSDLVRKVVEETDTKSVIRKANTSAAGDAVRSLKIKTPEKFKGITQASLVGAIKGMTNSVIDTIANILDYTAPYNAQRMRVKDEYLKIFNSDEAPEIISGLSAASKEKLADVMAINVVGAARRGKIKGNDPADVNKLVEMATVQHEVRAMSDRIRDFSRIEKAKAKLNRQIEKTNRANKDVVLYKEKEERRMMFEDLKNEAKKMARIASTSYGITDSERLWFVDEVDKLKNSYEADALLTLYNKFVKFASDAEYRSYINEANKSKKYANDKDVLKNVAPDRFDEVQRLLSLDAHNIPRELIIEYTDAINGLAKRGVADTDKAVEFVRKHDADITKTETASEIGSDFGMANVVEEADNIRSKPEETRTQEDVDRLQVLDNMINDMVYARGVSNVDDLNKAIDSFDNRVKEIEKGGSFTINDVATLKRMATGLAMKTEAVRQTMTGFGSGTFDSAMDKIHVADKFLNDIAPQLIKDMEFSAKAGSLVNVGDNINGMGDKITMREVKVDDAEKRGLPSKLKWFAKKNKSLQGGIRRVRDDNGKAAYYEMRSFYTDANGNEIMLSQPVAERYNTLVSLSNNLVTNIGQNTTLTSSQLIQIADVVDAYKKGNFTPQVTKSIMFLEADRIALGWNNVIVPRLNKEMSLRPSLGKILGSSDEIRNYMDKGQWENLSRQFGIANAKSNPLAIYGFGAISDAWNASRVISSMQNANIEAFYREHFGYGKGTFQSYSDDSFSIHLSYALLQLDHQSNLTTGSRVAPYTHEKMTTVSGKDGNTITKKELVTEYKIVDSDGSFIDDNTYATYEQAKKAREEMMPEYRSDRGVLDFHESMKSQYFNPDGSPKVNDYAQLGKSHIEAKNELNIYKKAEKRVREWMGFEEGDAFVFGYKKSDGTVVSADEDFAERLENSEKHGAPSWFKKGTKVFRDSFNNDTTVEMMRSNAENEGVTFYGRSNYFPHSATSINKELTQSPDDFVSDVFGKSFRGQPSTFSGNIFARSGGKYPIDLNARRVASSYFNSLSTAYAVRPQVKNLSEAFNRLRGQNASIENDVRVRLSSIDSSLESIVMGEAYDKNAFISNLKKEGVGAEWIKKAEEGVITPNSLPDDMIASLAVKNKLYIPYIDNITHGVKNNILDRTRRELTQRRPFSWFDNVKMRIGTKVFTGGMLPRVIVDAQSAKVLLTPLRWVKELGSWTFKMASGPAPVRDAFWKRIFKDWGSDPDWNAFLRSSWGSHLAFGLKSGQMDDRFIDARAKGKSFLAETGNTTVILMDNVFGKRISKGNFIDNFYAKTGEMPDFKKIVSDAQYRQKHEIAIKESISEVNVTMNRLNPSVTKFGRYDIGRAIGSSESKYQGSFATDYRNAMSVMASYSVNESLQFFQSLRDIRRSALRRTAGYDAGSVFVDSSLQIFSSATANFAYMYGGALAANFVYGKVAGLFGDEKTEKLYEDRLNSSLTIDAIGSNTLAAILSLTYGKAGGLVPMLMSHLKNSMSSAYVDLSEDKKKAKEELAFVDKYIRDNNLGQYFDQMNIRQHAGYNAFLLDIISQSAPLLGDGIEDIIDDGVRIAKIFNGDATPTEKELTTVNILTAVNGIMSLFGASHIFTADIEKYARTANAARYDEIKVEKEFASKVKEIKAGIQLSMDGNMSDIRKSRLESFAEGSLGAEQSKESFEQSNAKLLYSYVSGDYIAKLDYEIEKARVSNIVYKNGVAVTDGTESDGYKKAVAKKEATIEAVNDIGIDNIEAAYEELYGQLGGSVKRGVTPRKGSSAVVGSVPRQGSKPRVGK